MKVLFCTNLPSPYRVDFFNELGKMCDLTVCYERRCASDRDKKWLPSQAETFKEVYLDLKPYDVDKSIGDALRKYIISHPCDRLILTNYSSPTSMIAIASCRLRHIPYIIEYDGGFNKSEPMHMRLIKKYLLGKATAHITTCDEHIRYLVNLGVERSKIYKYPFTSVLEKNVLKEVPKKEEKNHIRNKLGIYEKKVIISVGRFNYQDGEGKGFDLLFQIAEKLDNDIGIYIIGDEPTYRFIKWKEEKKLNNVHFIPFKNKNDLNEYYFAADLMVLLTRGDVWGLVVNEAMACSLPVITTDRCMAGMEMIEDGVNGYIVSVNTYTEALGCIEKYYDTADIIKKDMSQRCLQTAREYTISKMVHRHMEIFDAL